MGVTWAGSRTFSIVLVATKNIMHAALCHVYNFTSVACRELRGHGRCRCRGRPRLGARFATDTDESIRTPFARSHSCRSEEEGPSRVMKVLALISGGKDSCYSLIECRRLGHEIVALANLHPPRPPPGATTTLLINAQDQVLYVVMFR